MANPFLVIPLAVLPLYVGVMMQTQKFKSYGLLFGDLEIRAYIFIACSIINQSNVKDASLLIAETIAVESNNGNTVDDSPNYGEGLTQFDRGTFDYIKNTFSDTQTAERIKSYLFIDLTKVQYQDLRKSPLLSIIFARLLYMTVSAPIPTTKQGRWEYYKKYFNSTLGATTQQKYFLSSSNSLIKEGVEYV